MTNFNKTSNPTINQCKVMIQNYYDKIYFLKSLSADGYLNISSEGIDSSLQCLKAGISEINTHKTEIKRQLKKRKLKRLKIRRAKSKIRENSINKRTELHGQIDRNLQLFAKETAVQLQKKQNIESINWKIKQIEQKIECSLNKQSLINGLMILRTLRENHSSGSTEENNHNQLSSLQLQLKTHISNLQTAKKLLEKSKIDPAHETRYTPELCEKLFGETIRNYSTNPLDRMSMDELIAARTYWDQFVVNDYDENGSYIPNYWIGESDESD